MIERHHRRQGLRPGVALALGSLLLATGQARAADDPHDWVQRMGYAVEYLNYAGTLVRLQGDEAAIMRVVHRVENGSVTERITAMDEVGREIIREGDETTCILPDQQSVLVERRLEQGSPLRQHFGAGLRFAADQYRLSAAPGGRLVGRDTRLITVRPTDTYRYGYRLWLDHATAIPLKVQIVDDRGEVVEQLLFSDIELPDRIPAASVQPTLALDKFTWLRGAATAPAALAADSATDSAWFAGTLPPGFELLGSRLKDAPAGVDGRATGVPMRQLVYSDGVASISVFIEAAGDPAGESAAASTMGAANVFSVVRDGHVITAVGEVPVRTLETIARAMRTGGIP